MHPLEEHSASPDSDLRPPALLIVDDDPVNLGVLGRLLKPHYNVPAAPSGERALQIAASTTKPDLILLDVRMPGMDGYAVLARLRIRNSWPLPRNIVKTIEWRRSLKNRAIPVPKRKT